MTERNSRDIFDREISESGGNLYNTSAQLSCKMSNSRLSASIANITDFKGKKIIDVGCGDGVFTSELLEFSPNSILGIDSSELSIDVAKKNIGTNSKIEFVVKDICDLKKIDKFFDIAIVRGVLHHLDDISAGIANISSIAKEVVVLEPNAYNLMVRVVLKISKWHIERGEKVISPSFLISEFKKSQFCMSDYKFFNLVPLFCPDYIAHTLKFFEPVVEKFPIVNKLFCGSYVAKFKRNSD